MGGHNRLPTGHWIITSRVRYLDPEQGLAVTASSWRIYALSHPFATTWPYEALDLIATAMTRWGIPGGPPLNPLPREVLCIEIARRGLDGSADSCIGDANPADTDQGTAQ